MITDKRIVLTAAFLVLTAGLAALAGPALAADKCADCHKKHSSALVMEWERSKHAGNGVDCLSCHKAVKENPGSWVHHGERISMIVTPNAGAQCHTRENE